MVAIRLDSTMLSFKAGKALCCGLRIAPGGIRPEPLSALRRHGSRARSGEYPGEYQACRTRRPPRLR